MTARPNFDSLITCPKPIPQASLRLFCFPYAGASSLVFRSWSNSLPSSVEVCPIELPGRGTQMRLAPFSQLEPLVHCIACALLPHLDKPFGFFGHSMGALISFELTRLLRQKYGTIPVHLFLSGRRAPQILNSKPPIHNLPEPAFIEELRILNGTPEAVLENAELMQLLLPILRADFAVLETYVYTEQPPLACSITAFGGLQDQEVNLEEIEAWRQQTSGSFSLHMLPGDHFFINSHQLFLMEILAHELARYY